MRGYFDLIERYRYRLLFTILLATILLQPILDGILLGQAILMLAYGAILTGGVYATQPRPWVTVLCLTLSFVVVGLSWFFLFSGSRDWSLALVAVTFLFGAFVASRTVATLLSAPATNADALAGAVFGYLLLVVVWALFYRSLDIWSPVTFALTTDSDRFSELLYFSLVTITTLGYGDVLPVSSFARISAGLEAAAGTLYIAIMIARIVGTLSRGQN